MKPIKLDGKQINTSEELFYHQIYNLINNLLINNKNYKGDYYYNINTGNMNFSKLLEDTKERAQYILERMEQTKHLINIEEKNV